MSTFRFNFSLDSNVRQDAEQSPPVAVQESVQWLESEEVKPLHQINDLNKFVNHARMIICGDVEIGHVVASEVLSGVDNLGLKNALELADSQHSDLITGKYEGGLKIWECTSDLLQYLVDNEDKITYEGKKVLDLGCGAGILGIFCFMNGSHVTFQDYNKEVLEQVTIPNVLLNIEEEEKQESAIKNCKFYSGDWESFNKNCNECYDIILTSETIYNETNYDKLISLFLKKLKKNGVIYVAAKTCYFGVGGGMRNFEARLKKNDQLQSKLCWKSEGGIQREIIKVTWNL